MAHVTTAEVQQWLEPTKLTLTEVPNELEQTAAEHVFAKLRVRYQTAGWLDANTTPALVRKIISMLVAGWYYNTAYSDQVQTAIEYGYKLVSFAESLLGGLIDGTNSLSEGQNERDPESYPSFFPTDLATAIADESGWDAEGAAPRAFTMGKVF